MIPSSVISKRCGTLVMLAWLISLIGVPGLFSPALLFAGTKIQNDPKGFQGITWGSPLTDVPDLRLAESSDIIKGSDKGTILVKGYDFQKGPPNLGQATLQYMRFFSLDGKFARVTIRYKGEKNHEKLLDYLESQFGALDRSPGSMMRGLNQQFNWRGTETEVNLTYDGFQERGFLFIESRILAPRFNEGLPEHAY